MLTVEKKELLNEEHYDYVVSEEEMERFNRKKERAKEIGIDLFILDERDIPEELEKLEDYIIDNYLELDLEVPEDLKKKYRELKNSYFGEN